MKIIPDKRNRYEIIIKRVYVFKNVFKNKKSLDFSFRQFGLFSEIINPTLMIKAF